MSAPRAEQPTAHSGSPRQTWSLWWLAEAGLAFDPVSAMLRRLEVVPSHAATVALLSRTAAEEATSGSRRILDELIITAPQLRDQLRPRVGIEYLRALALLVTFAALVFVSSTSDVLAYAAWIAVALYTAAALQLAVVVLCRRDMTSRITVAMTLPCAIISTIVTLVAALQSHAVVPSVANAAASITVWGVALGGMRARHRDGDMLRRNEQQLQDARQLRDRTVQVIVQSAEHSLRKAWAALDGEQRSRLIPVVSTNAPLVDVPGIDAIRQAVACTSATGW